ncbi:MAG: DUF1801 domain-containing protein [Oscillospiraceae bacterium]|nr:DUF1801 domain-containing protein [Oscillospiraceae bacterium]
MWTCPKCGREFKNTNQNHFCGEIDTIDAYIAEQAEDVREILSQVRAVIREAAPEATEKLAWKMPTFWQEKNVIQFAAHKKHLGLYPGDLTGSPFAEYQSSKGTIQIPYDKIDLDLIADVTRWRVKCVTGQ